MILVPWTLVTTDGHIVHLLMWPTAKETIAKKGRLRCSRHENIKILEDAGLENPLPSSSILTLTRQ